MPIATDEAIGIANELLRGGTAEPYQKSSEAN